MKTRKSLLATLVILSAITVVVGLTSSGLSRRGLAQTGPAVDKSHKRLGVEIHLNKSMLIPAAMQGRILEAFLRVDNDDVRAAGESFSAVKVGAAEAGKKIEVTVSVLSGDISAVKSCKDWWMLKESKVASYYLSEGEEVTVPQLSHLGSTFKEGKLAFKAVPLPQEIGARGGRKMRVRPMRL